MKKKINLKLTCEENIFIKHASRSNFISVKVFNDDLFAINRIKEELVLNGPIYVGMAILDLFKLLMYDFHYNYLLKRYNIKLMFTDTAVFVMKLKLMMFIKIYFKIQNHLIIVITPKIASSF